MHRIPSLASRLATMVSSAQIGRKQPDSLYRPVNTPAPLDELPYQNGIFKGRDRLHQARAKLPPGGHGFRCASEIRFHIRIGSNGPQL